MRFHQSSLHRWYLTRFRVLVREFRKKFVALFECAAADGVQRSPIAETTRDARTVFAVDTLYRAW